MNRVQTQCIALGVIALGFFVYANTLRNEFVWDDASSILLHQTVQDPSSVLQLFQEDQHAYAGGQGNFYRPLLAVTFMVDFWLSYSGPTIAESNAVTTELSPFLFHVDSIVWHCLAAVFLLLVLTNFGAPLVVRAMVPVLYVVHPLHTEAVAYISGRADSMSAAFMFAGLYCATIDATGKRAWALSGGVLACFVAGLLSKESSFIFPGLLVLAYWAHNRVRESGWRPHQWATMVGTGLALGIYGLLRTGSGPLNFGSDSQAPSTSFGERIIETVQSFAYYVQLLFHPTNLHMERTLTDATGATTVFGLVSLGVIVAIGVAAIVRKQYRMVLAAAWFLLTWLPISGLFPLNAPMAEHWMYVPMGGFLWLLLELLMVVVPTRLPENARTVYVYAGVVLLCNWCIHLAMVSVERNPDWRSNTAIYEATLRENPKSSRVNYNLAVTYQDLLGNKSGAKRHYRDVLALHQEKKVANGTDTAQLWDEEIQSHFSLGQLYLEEKRYAEASSHFGVLGGMTPNAGNRDILGLSLYGLGQCFLYTGDRARAEEFFGKAVSVVPELESEIRGLL